MGNVSAHPFIPVHPHVHGHDPEKVVGVTVPVAHVAVGAVYAFVVAGQTAAVPQA